MPRTTQRYFTPRAARAPRAPTRPIAHQPYRLTDGFAPWLCAQAWNVAQTEVLTKYFGGGIKQLIREGTGGGKTLMYFLPVLDQLLGPDGKLKAGLPTDKPTVAITVHTKGLVDQIMEDAQSFLFGRGVTFDWYYGNPKKGKGHWGNFREHLVVGTVDGLSRLSMDLSAVTMVVVDEADSVWVEKKDKLRTIMRQVPAACGRMFLSATFTDEEKDGLVKLGGPETQVYENENGPESGAVIPTVRQLRCQVADTAAMRAAVALIVPALRDVAGQAQRQCMIFLATKKGVDTEVEELTKLFAKERIKARPYHSDLAGGDKERKKNDLDFKAGLFEVLVVTPQLDKGYNNPGVTIVVQYEPPDDNTEYVHRAGRADRAKSGGTSIVLHTAAKRAAVDKLEAAQRRFGAKAHPKNELLGKSAVIAEMTVDELVNDQAAANSGL